jgi:signal peptide peptidase SppA
MPDTPTRFCTRSPLWLIAMDRALPYFAGAMTAREKAEPQPKRDGASALVRLAGPLAKDSLIEFFGGTSSVAAQMEIRAAAADPEVDSIYLLIDSPGGEVAGTEELAGEVRAARAVKPVHAHIDDLGASAAYWVASQATRITANATGEVGSIGTVAVIADYSELFAKEGIQVHVVTSGDKKAGGALARGSEITKDAIKDVQKRLDAMAGQFKDAVAAGRGMTADEVKKVGDGRILSAPEAVEAGLIDGISTRNGAFHDLRGTVDTAAVRRQRRASARAEFAELRKRSRYPF